MMGFFTETTPPLCAPVHVWPAWSTVQPVAKTLLLMPEPLVLNTWPFVSESVHCTAWHVQCSNRLRIVRQLQTHCRDVAGRNVPMCFVLVEDLFNTTSVSGACCAPVCTDTHQGVALSCFACVFCGCCPSCYVCVPCGSALKE